jgi:tetratricopeptide (TPR) repeat protein
VRALTAGGEPPRELRPDQTLPAWGRAVLAGKATAIPAGAAAAARPPATAAARPPLPGAVASSETIPAPPLESLAAAGGETVAPPEMAPPADDAARHAPPTPPPVVAEPGVEAAAAPTEQLTMMDVERILMEGDVRMTISDYASAVKSYSKLVDLLPNVAAYRLKLAIAMTCWPRTAKQAERQFLEALRLEPNNANLHYQFGLYYKAMKQRARALTEMRTALSLDPRHKEARKELEALSPKDSALTSLKKLFR